VRELRGNTGSGAKGFGPAGYVKITIFGFALASLWSSLHSIILPLRLLDFVAESQKNTYLGILTFAGLILAMLAQPIVGAISDRSGFSWGRRRPFVLLGTIAAILFLPGIGLAGSYAVLLLTYCFLQLSSNTAQGPLHGFIPDLVPESKRGLASGVKSLLEVLGGLTTIRLIAYLMSHYFAGEGGAWLWLALAVLTTVLLGAMIATVLMVKEQPGAGGPKLPILATLYKSFKIDLRTNRDFIWFLISRGLMGMPGVMLQLFALYYLMDFVGLADPVAATADLLIVAGVCLLAVVYPAGRLSDRIGRKPIIVSSGLLGAVGIVLLFFSQSYIHIMLSGALLGIANGAFLSSSWALATDLVVKGEEARYLGLTNLAIAGGSALARLIGPVIDFFNAQSAGLGYQVMLGVCFICFVAGALLLMKTKGRLNRGSHVLPPNL
jgi:Na+/melibiose symporter-like transporter